MVGSLCGALGFWVLTDGSPTAPSRCRTACCPAWCSPRWPALPCCCGAAGGALVAAALIAFASRDARVGPDTGTAIAVTGLVGLGALLALAPEAPQRLEELLFGDPLGVTGGDLLAAALLLVLGGAALAALHRPLSALAFDPAGAAAAGIRPGTMRFALLILLAAAVAVAVQGLGALLVLAVLIGPPMAVRDHASTPARAMLGGAAVAVAASLVGIEVSFHAHSAAGASVALALCAAAALGVALRRSPRAARGRARPRSRRPAPSAQAR